MMELADDEKLKMLKENREPVTAPSYPSYYTPKPGGLGKILLFTGPPGVVKQVRSLGCL